MSDDLEDEVFLIENGNVIDEDVLLMQGHAFENEGGFEIGGQIQDFIAANQQIEEDGGEENNQKEFQEGPLAFPGIEMPQDGFKISASTSSSVPSIAQSSSIVCEQSEVIGASSRIPYFEPGCYVNESYQRDTTELSEFKSSVEIDPQTGRVKFKQSSLRKDDTSEVKEFREPELITSISSSEMKEAQTATSKAGFAKPGNSAQASTSTFEDSKEMIPPSTPASFGIHYERSGHTVQLLRRYRNRENPQVQQLNHPDRPSSMFMKCGSCLLILLLVLFLAIAASLEDLLPHSILTPSLVLWPLIFIGVIGCFIKACWEEQNTTLETPVPRSTYGSTGNMSGLTNTA